jgi:hypothetical protein
MYRPASHFPCCRLYVTILKQIFPQLFNTLDCFVLCIYPDILFACFVACSLCMKIFHFPLIIPLSYFISHFLIWCLRRLLLASGSLILVCSSFSSVSHFHPLLQCFILVVLLFNSSVVNVTIAHDPDARPVPTATEPQEIDLIYQVLKQAGEISSSRSGTTRPLTPAPPATASSATTMHGSVCVKQPEQPNGTGSSAPSAGSFHRRSGPSQQQPLLLRGAASSLTVGPVPHASISGVFVPSCFGVVVE